MEVAAGGSGDLLLRVEELYSVLCILYSILADSIVIHIESKLEFMEWKIVHNITRSRSRSPSFS